MASRTWAYGLALSLIAGCSTNTGSTGVMTNPDGADGSDGSQSDGNPGDGEGDGDGASGDGNGDGDGDGSDFCEELTVRAETVVPDVLIALDKSRSMVWVGCAAAGLSGLQVGCPNPPAPYDRAFDRWAPSVAALKDVTAALEERVRFGLMLFPDRPIPGSGLFTPDQICQPGFMVVEPDLNTAGAIASGLDAQQPDGESTPIAGTLRKAREFYAATPSTETRYVLLVTDGGPNCSVDADPAESEDDFRLCQEQSYAEVDALREAGVHTFVIGYDTAVIPELAAVLDELAKRGGTGDTQHRPVEDGASLLSQFESITGSIASCSYQLEAAPGDPAYVRVTLDGVDLPQGDNGWMLRDDTTIELLGDACATLRSGGVGDHQLNIQVECDPVILE